MTNVSPNPDKPTRAETEAFIAEVTQRLKGPLHNFDRAMLVAERSDARAHLAAIEKAEGLT